MKNTNEKRNKKDAPTKTSVKAAAFFRLVGSKLAQFFRFVGRMIAKFFKSIYSNKQAAAGFTIVLIYVFFALFGSLIFPYDMSTNSADRFLPVSAEHWLGTDEMGRDVFRQLIYGTKSVLSIAFLTAVFTCLLGVILGMLSGYVGGWLDKIIQSLTNLFLSVPSFPILLLFASMFTIEDDITFALVLSAWSWAGLCRTVRAQIVSLKERDFIQICKVIHFGNAHILFKELLPNILSYVLINFVMIMRSAITGSVGIMMLGLAAFDPANWGAMLNRARQIGLVDRNAMLFMLKPLFTIIVLQTGVIMLSNGLDEILNPRLRVE